MLKKAREVPNEVLVIFLLLFLAYNAVCAYVVFWSKP